MHESSLFARQASTCAEPYHYYQCSKGPFEGCCAVDPCDDGICREEDEPPTSSAAADDSQSQTTTLMTTKTIMSTASVTSTTSLGSDQDRTNTAAASVATTTLVTSAGYSVITETVAAPTNTAVKNGSSNAIDGISTSTSSSHKGAIIGGAIGGVVGGIVLFLALYLWYRKRKASKASTSFGSREKDTRKRGSAGLQVSSDFTSSSSWTGPFEHYNDKNTSPFRQHINRTRSSILSELDSSPISPLTRVPRTMTSADTIFELDSINNHKHELEHTYTHTNSHSLSPETPMYQMSSTSSRYTEHGGGSNYSWGPASEPDFSRVSSGSNGGVRLASAGHSSTKSNTHLGWHK
ncbi:hypothetical protein DPV78_012120 [Talaromyces pinophilus]|nr:hypothetical protein DPV78_012120 [Talaromyces pinophilus]